MANEIANAASTANQPALPDAWVDRLFQRFAAMYGSAWAAKWDGVPMHEVKAVWASDLGFASAEQLRRALEHCKGHNTFPPSAPEFVALCRAFAPVADTRNRLPPPRGGDVEPAIAAKIEKLLSRENKPDPKGWAWAILEGERDGTYRYAYGIDLARRALGVPA